MYPIVEIATALLWGWMVARHGFGLEALRGALFGTLLQNPWVVGFVVAVLGQRQFGGGFVAAGDRQGLHGRATGGALPHVRQGVDAHPVLEIALHGLTDVGRSAAVHADDHRGNSLIEKRQRRLSVRRLQLGVAVHVHEARRDQQAGDIHRVAGADPHIARVAHELNPITGDADVGLDPRIPGAVKHAAIPDDEVETSLSCTTYGNDTQQHRTQEPENLSTREPENEVYSMAVVKIPAESRVVEGDAAVGAFLATQGIEWTIGFDPGAEAALAFGTRGQPETFAITADGVIVGYQYGPSTVRTLETLLERARQGSGRA